jgi:hypothetical protein
MLTRTAKAEAKSNRLEDLKATLERRRSELAHDVLDKIRDVRSDGITERGVLDTAEGDDGTSGQREACSRSFDCLRSIAVHEGHQFVTIPERRDGNGRDRRNRCCTP